MDCDEMEQQMKDKRKAIKEKQDRDKDSKGLQSNIHSPKPAVNWQWHTNSSEQTRARDQKMQQKQWLDDQMKERKLRSDNEKRSEIELQDSIFKSDSQSQSKLDRGAHGKKGIEHQIQDYNVQAAKQKRANDKKQKELDKIDPSAESKPSEQDLVKLNGEIKRLEEQKEEMMQKERSLSRDIRQMSAQN